MERRNFDIGIIVPLREEFRYVVEIAPKLESISHEGRKGKGDANLFLD
jgi:hypothetical protein